MDKNTLIAKYILEELSEKEQKEFNYLMENDSEFKKEFEFQNNLKTVISKEEQDSIKGKLKVLEKELSTKSLNTKKWMAAASVIILLGVSLFWFTNDSIDSNALFDRYYEPYRNVVQPLVRGENNTDTKSKAFEAYENKDYESALNYFNSALEQNNDDAVRFYKGITQLHLGNTQDAISTFNSLKDLPKHLKPQANWYLALAYLKRGNIEKTRLTLQTLNSSNSAFKNEEVDSLLVMLD